MSTSNANPTSTSSQKRPLEEPSSEVTSGDQRDPKRPAIEGGMNKDDSSTSNETDATLEASANAPADSDDKPAVNTSAAMDTTTTAQNPIEASITPSNMVAASTVLETHPIQSTASMTSAPDTATDAEPNANQDETQWIHVRCLLTNAETATIIGRGGDNVTTVRRKAGAQCTISSFTQGAVERVLTVSGLPDAVAKAFGLIVRTLNQESLDERSTAQSKQYRLGLLIPHVVMGAIIGQRGSRIREIQDYSGARLNVSDSCLPLSTERSLAVIGVADSVHIATYYICTTLVNQLNEKHGGPAASGYATRNGGPSAYVTGGMMVMPYTPQAVGGRWGHPNSYYARQAQAQAQTKRAQASSYGGANAGYPATSQPYGYQHSAAAYAGRQAHPGAAPPTPQSAHFNQPAMAHAQPPQQPQQSQTPAFPGQQLTQQIYIPNDMVGAIIGKGGAKINEIRLMSGSNIKINEPQDNSNERLVTISGGHEQNQMALYMLYSRLESEKHRV